MFQTSMIFLSFDVLLTFLGCSHSDNNLVELERETINEDDRAVLLEGGLSKSPSVKLFSYSVKTNLIRYICSYMQEFYIQFWTIFSSILSHPWVNFIGFSQWRIPFC